MTKPTIEKLGIAVYAVDVRNSIVILNTDIAITHVLDLLKFFEEAVNRASYQIGDIHKGDIVKVTNPVDGSYTVLPREAVIIASIPV